MVKSTGAVGLEPIDQLAEKVQSLVGVLERTRTELTQTAEDNVRLSHEIDALRAKLSTAESLLSTAEDQGARTKDLETERDQIRARVTGLLEQLEGLSL